MKRMAGILTIVALCGASPAFAQAPVADYFSTTSTLNNEPLSAGLTIEAFDAEGNRCGFAQTNADGSFLIHVYGDDPITPAIDEGTLAGEFPRWKISAFDVMTSDVTWIANLVGSFNDMRWENGAAKQMQLDAASSAVDADTWSAVKERYRP